MKILISQSAKFTPMPLRPRDIKDLKAALWRTTAGNYVRGLVIGISGTKTLFLTDPVKLTVEKVDANCLNTISPKDASECESAEWQTAASTWHSRKTAPKTSTFKLNGSKGIQGRKDVMR